MTAARMFRLLLAVSAFSGLVVPDIHAQTPDVAFEELLPEETLLSLSVPSTSALVTKFKETHAYKIIDDLDLGSLMRTEPQFLRVRELYNTFLKPLTGIFRGRLTAALVTLPVEPRMLRAVILADIAGDPGVLRAYLTQTLEPALAQLGAQITTFSHGKCQVRQVSFGNPVPLSAAYTIAEDVFVLTLGKQQPIEELLDARERLRAERAAALAQDRVPLIYCTDLFHPPVDPDDWFDLATAFSLKALDIRAIVLDQGDKQMNNPGSIPLRQVSCITGRDVPSAAGLPNQLTSPSDKGLDQPKELQGGVELILNTLEASDKKVTVIAVGSLRDLCAAFNRRPQLLKDKLEKVYVVAGDSEGGEEYNVKLDPHAYVGIMRSGLPIYWLPCFGKQPFVSHWKFRQGELLDRWSPKVQNYLAYGLTKADPAKVHPLLALSMPIPEGVRSEIWAAGRSMWSTAAFLDAAGNTVAKNAGRWAVLPRTDDAAAQPVFRFVPAAVAVGNDGVTRIEDINPQSSEPNMHILSLEGPPVDDYPDAMKQALGDLLADLEPSHQKSLAGNPLFRLARQRMGNSRDLFVYWNTSVLFDEFSQSLPPQFNAIIRGLGLAGVKAMGTGVQLQGSAVKDSLFLITGPEREGLLGLLPQKTTPLKAASALPERVTMFYGASIGDFREFWDKLEAVIQDLVVGVGGNEPWKRMSAGLRQWEQKTGYRIKDDLLSPFSGEVCVAAQMPEVVGLPQVVVLLETKDPEKGKALCRNLGDIIRKGFEGRCIVFSQEYRGVTISSCTILPSAGKLAVIGGAFIRPAFAQVGDFFVFGLQGSTVKKIVDVYNGGRPLKDDPEFQRVLGKVLENGNATSYANMGDLYDFFISTFSPMAAQQFGPGLVSRLGKIRPYFGRAVGRMAVDRDGILFENFSESGGVESLLFQLMITNVFVPQALAAGETARRASEIASCRVHLSQLARACVMYANDHNGILPSTLSDLYPDYVQNLRFFVCPTQKIQEFGKSEIDALGSYALQIPGADLSKITNPAATAMIVEKKPNHMGSRSVAHADGHVSEDRNPQSPPAPPPAKRILPFLRPNGASRQEKRYGRNVILALASKSRVAAAGFAANSQ